VCVVSCMCVFVCFVCVCERGGVGFLENVRMCECECVCVCVWAGGTWGVCIYNSKIINGKIKRVTKLCVLYRNCKGGFRINPITADARAHTHTHPYTHTRMI